MKKIRIGDRLIGEGEPTFIIAEAGVNHNGDVELARRLIDVAKEAEVDAVKFQSFQVDKLSIKSEPQYEMLQRLELKKDDFILLSGYAKDKGVKFLSSPFDEEGVDLLVDLEVPAIKVASGEITNLPFLRYIAKKGLSIILSTGMSTLGEIEEAVDTIKSEGNEDIILLHCTSNYPAKPEDVNLKAMDTLRQAFNLQIGYSDHTLGIEIALASVSRGAKVLEKHFTLDKNLPGPDHKTSLEPFELKQMVEGIRAIEKAMGSGLKRPVSSELKVRKTARRSIVAKTDIQNGMTITQDMLAIKRPGFGLSPKYIDLVIGRKAKRYIRSDEVITWNDI
ncbi:MAG: N-acetylneuraminate synthase [bacterium]|nr:N-acetylneuraminate synthase [bacterium]